MRDMNYVFSIPQHGIEFKCPRQHVLFPLREDDSAVFENVIPYLISEKYYIAMVYNFTSYGGVHGFFNTNYINYSFEKNKVITIEDILNTTDIDEISKIIKNCIKEKYKIPQSVALDEAENTIFLSDGVEMSDVFTIHKNGLTFYFPSGVLTSHGYGEYLIFVLYEKLKNYLKVDFKY